VACPPWRWTTARCGTLNLGEWTQEAIEAGYRARVIDEFQILSLVRDGWITGPEGAPYGSTGIVVNCPIVARFL